jgi:hypothetical protein
MRLDALAPTRRAAPRAARAITKKADCANQLTEEGGTFGPDTRSHSTVAPEGTFSR